MLTLTVQLSPAAAQALRDGQPGDDLRSLLRARSLQLLPLHPASADPALRQFYSVVIPEPDEARILDGLRACAGVEAAYLKPRDEPP